ncbi:MAG: hypothetical protein ACRYGC_13160 [Janthinobacterium lividum]
MSKRPRPADLRQPDLFAAPGQPAPSPDAAPSPTPARPKPRSTAPRARRAAAPTPEAPPQASEPPAPEPAVIEPLAALPAPPPAPEPPARPAFRRVDPLAPRAADRPDSFLYCVLPRDAAEAVLRDGLPDESPPALVERGAVPRALAAAAEELGWSDEQPGALCVLRVRRTEIAPADASPAPRLRRLA